MMMIFSPLYRGSVASSVIPGADEHTLGGVESVIGGYFILD